MVRFSRIWRVVVRMGHPQIRWSVLLMTQHEGMPAELQGNGVDVRTLPLKAMECGIVVRGAVIETLLWPKAPCLLTSHFPGAASLHPTGRARSSPCPLRRETFVTGER